MIETADSLYGQLTEGIAMRRMTIIASSHRRMRPLDPRIILWIHDMAIDACRRVIRQIGGPICVQKRKETYPDDKSGHEAEKWCLLFHRRPTYNRSMIV